MKYIQLLLVCTLFIGTSAYAQTPDNVMRAFEHISPDELDQDGSRPAADAVLNEDKMSSAIISVYPNPSKGGASKVAIRNSGPVGSTIQISIIDGNGWEFNVRQLTTTSSSFEYNLDEYNTVKPGMYTVKVVLGEEVITEQWIVQ